VGKDLIRFYQGDQTKEDGMGWGGASHIALAGNMINACKILAGNPERKRPLWRPFHQLENNITIGLNE
jgi:hypothetical protein